MAVETHIYDKRFFRNTLALEGDSARAAVNILIKEFGPRSVVDVGCGNGIYLAQFEKAGVDILGFDGAPAAVEGSLVGSKIKLHDLCEPLELEKKYDLCLCMEVAEHLPEECADTLLDSLAGASDKIVFTAAVPGQGPRSIGHINEQPHGYWVEKFKQKGLTYRRSLSYKLRKEMKEAGVVWWIVKNLMVFEVLTK